MHHTRVVFLGDANVGKTSLIGRISSNEFKKHYAPTTAANFVTIKPDKDDSYEIQIWDTAGMERYRAVNKIYFREAVGAIIVFDFTQKKTFIDVEMWKNDFRESDALPDAVIIVVGNKYDMRDEFEVEESEVIKWAQANGVQYFSVSALTGEGVTEMVAELGKSVPRNEVKAETLITNTVNTEEKKKCC